MKKIFALIALVLVLLTSSTMAAESRWHYLASTSNVNIYVDSMTIRSYGNDGDKYLDFWIKAKFNEAYILEHYNLRLKNSNYLELDYAVFDSKGNQTQHENRRQNGWKQLTPDTNLESIMRKTVAFYCSNR